ncbi:3'-5' exonuclease [bacterium]|nr:3'-5' exonuclease [bacterium]
MLGVFLDTETNGLDWSVHSILEIAFVIINVKTGEKIASYQAMQKLSSEMWAKGDKDSLAYTKITQEEVEENGKEKEVIQEEILTLFKEHNIHRGKAVFICQNPGFDRSFFSTLVDIKTQEELGLPYYWLDLASMYWSKRIVEHTTYHFCISKDAIAEYYHLPPEKKPHRAMQGVEHLIECYNSVVGYPKTNAQ